MALEAIRNVKTLLQSEESGQTLVEYSMIIALFSVALITSLTFFAGGLNHMMDTIIQVVDGLV